jgi:hypothetical protein
MTESRKLRIALAVIALLLILVAAMVWRFIVVGSTGSGRDGRTVVVVEPAERAFVLKEMRDMLAGVQGLTDALAAEDFAAAAKLAHGLGADPDSSEAAALMGKLPLEFKTLGLAVHADFKRLAKDAEAKAPPKDLLRQLSGTLQKCVACHARYQFGTPEARQLTLGGRPASRPAATVLAVQY